MLVCNDVPIISVCHTFGYKYICGVAFVQRNALTKTQRLGRERNSFWICSDGEKEGREENVIEEEGKDGENDQSMKS